MPCPLCDEAAILLCQWCIGGEVCRVAFCERHAGELWGKLSPPGRESFAMHDIAERTK